MILVISSSCIALIILKYVPSIPTSFSAFTIKASWFSQSIFLHLF
jgi:hypothetical protein